MLLILAGDNITVMSPNLLTESLYKSFIRCPQAASIKDTFPANVPTLKEQVYIPHANNLVCLLTHVHVLVQSVRHEWRFNICLNNNSLNV